MEWIKSMLSPSPQGGLLLLFETIRIQRYPTIQALLGFFVHVFLEL